jgi:hypothetical protein
MLDRVLSGGQTGADQAGWRAAKACGIPTGGFMPLGFLTEVGPRPEFAELYGAVVLPTADYPSRTRRNVFEASTTIWFGSFDSPGSKLTHRACLDYGRTCFGVNDGVKPSDVVRWLAMNGYRSLNVAGNRETVNSGIGERAERFPLAVFRQVARG